jgi:hypothetical protein
LAELDRCAALRAIGWPAIRHATPRPKRYLLSRCSTFQRMRGCRVRCMPTFVLRLIAPRPNFAQTMTDAEREIMNRHADHWRPYLERGDMELLAVTGLIEDGKLTPVVDRTYPWPIRPRACATWSRGTRAARPSSPWREIGGCVRLADAGHPLLGMCGRPKRLRRFVHAQNDLIWTAADATELDLAAARSGGAVRVVATGCLCSRK